MNEVRELSEVRMFKAKGSTSAKVLRQELLSLTPGASGRETVVARRQWAREECQERNLER